ncbi:hypothetical protein KCU95_g4861, partial [Aureobasidium melanogenum]
MGVRSAQDQLCALASQFTSLAGLGDHSDPELQRYLAIRITDAIRRELVQRGAIQPDQQPTIWEGGPRLDLPEQSAINTLNPATFGDEEMAIRTEAMPDRSQTDEEDMDMSDNADRNYVVGLSQEVFAAKLHKCILDASDNNLKTVEPQFTATLPMKHFTELVAFQSNTEVTADMERRAFIDLPSMEETLKYGYCGFRDDNYSWSITIRDDEEGGLGAFSTVPIKAGSFVGFLPGYCRFSPEKENRMEVEGFIESHLLGLFFEDQGCCGLLSYMKRTNFGAEGNVIGGWEQYNDDMDGNPMPWCIVIFAYRDIPALTPLVFWDHMRFD